MSSSFLPASLMAILHTLMGLVLPAFVFAAGLQLRGLMPGRVVLAFFFWSATVVVAHMPYMLLTLRSAGGAGSDEMAAWSSIASLMGLLTALASAWLGMALLAVLRRLRNLSMLDPGGPMDREG